MTKTFKFFLFFSLILLTASCTWVRPEYEGVFMENCGRNGISDFKIVTGRVSTIEWCTELIKVPMFEQSGHVPKMTVTTKDAGTFEIDPSYSYSAMRTKGPEIAFTYRQFDSGKTFLDEIEENILNRRVINVYRQEAREFTTDSLMRSLNQFEKQVEVRLKEEFEKAFFNLREITSGLIPPESLRQAIEERNAVVLDGERMRQQMEKEKATLAIELEKAEVRVQIAKAEALANLERAKGLSYQVLQEMAIKGWVEAGCPMPAVVGESNTSFYNIPLRPK